jgi:hypothetical protein
MPWQPHSVSGRGRRTKRARFHLDETVGPLVKGILEREGFNVVTAAERGLLRRPDEDHFADCWRTERTLITHDWDFMDAAKLPDYRNPGVIVLDSNRRKAKEVVRTAELVRMLCDVVGPSLRHMRAIIGSDGTIRLWRRQTKTGSIIVERIRFRRGRNPEIWVDEVGRPRRAGGPRTRPRRR